MKHFCIFTNPHKDRDLAVTNRIKAYLESRQIKYSLRITDEDTISDEADVILVLGGDGTMLNAAREIKGRKNIPLLGINLGTLGYLAEVEPDKTKEAIDKVLAGEYELESRMMIGGTILRAGEKVITDRALNDVVIRRVGTQQVMVFNLYVNRKLLNRYQADGIIITTPTGSTGYNLSAGGPIVEPSARLLVVTPICPHTMIQRSIVLSENDVVEIEIPAGREGQIQNAVVSFDGYAEELVTGDSVRIVKADITTDFIKIGKAGFLETLHRKMSENS
ncbi:MAG: NAD(+)/NADH kinase [Lachnospiraceae bacterium]